jgi:hypothetical protein
MARVQMTRPLEDEAIEQTRRHPILRATPDQIRAYVDANVTNLATAKAMMAEIAVVVSALAKRVQ